MKRIKRSEVITVKTELHSECGGQCVLCQRELGIDEFHLDHSHEDTGEKFPGRVRGALCNLCNPTVGTMIHKFNRSGLRKHVDFHEWFERTLSYLNDDYSHMPLHPTAQLPEEKERLMLKRKLKKLKRSTTIEQTKARIKELNSIIKEINDNR